MKTNVIQILMLSILAIATILVIAGGVFADSFALFCLGKGEVLDLAQTCPPLGTRKVNGPSNICVHLLDNGKICQASPNVCNSLGVACTGGANTTLDTKPPVLNIINPVQDHIYKERALPLILETDESSNILYTDLINGRGKWTTVCQHCDSYNNKRSFKEGLNSLMFQAKDESGNKAYKNVSFFLDSQKPRISMTMPRKGFASGTFELDMKEDNPKTLVLHYGNINSTFLEKALDIDTECTAAKGKSHCETSVNLDSFNGGSVLYWFVLTDIADNLVSSKPVQVDVDTQFPVVTYLNYTINKNTLKLSMNITEAHFDSVEYIDNFATRPTWRKVCTSLKNGMCNKDISGFRAGEHELSIQVNDKAGNSISIPLTINI